MSGERRHRPTRRRKKHALSRSMRAELQFPVSRVDRLLREAPDVQRLSWCTSVFFTGILEYLTANVLELASKEAVNHHKVLITPEHVERALDNSPLSSIFEDDTHPRGGGMPSARK
ncbi:histone H2A-Bbd type 1-like [Pteropus medius]|uniref:histone H2A-Bbd type 1-like n=1 Tax=Pteropus vampyrus TaxID=132908 RepID=UPI00196A6D1F|nr:histone H2A-Bbd type 1-like [Pteropus giganteus]